MRLSGGTTRSLHPVSALRDVDIEIDMNNDAKNNSNDFIANVFKHDAFRKGVAAAAAGTLFAIASIAIFGPSEPS